MEKKNDIKIERLTVADYDEWLSVLNRVFTIKNRRQMDFETELPKMCVRDDEHMNKHLAVKKHGRIVSVVGIYPLLVNVLGEELLFATVGNIATLPEEEGNGYMTMLLDAAMEELNRIGADGSRLCGDRMRYNRYGYEYAGAVYNFDIFKHHTDKKFQNFKSDICFAEVKEDDFGVIAEMKKIYENEKFFVCRDDNDFYKTLCAWKYKPYVAFKKDGAVAGYLSVSENCDYIAELYAKDTDTYSEILLQWINEVCKEKISIGIMPHKKEELGIVSKICQSCSITNPSMFKILSWEKVINAFSKLKNGTFTEKQSVIQIKGYGNLLVKTENNIIVCEKTNCDFDISLTPLEAVNFFFGTYPEYGEFDFFRNEFLLPFSWSLLDRV